MKKTTVLAIAGLAMFVGIAGGSVLKVVQTNAQTPSASTTNQTAQFNPSKGGHVGSNGTREELLTGDTAEKVKAAALTAVPGGTIERVENDAEGSPYEAHMTKSDGSHITVKVDSNFKVTTTEDGPKHSGRPQ
jgi:hypothetical protein